MKLADLNLLSDLERQRLTDLGKGAELAMPTDVTIAEVFGERAAASPDVRAVVFGADSLTYRELDDWSDQLAEELTRSHRIGPDSIAALCFSRGIEMIVAIIAVWKAGGAYAPIDLEIPDDRARYLLEDTATGVVLCGAEHLDWINRLSPAAARPAVLTLDGALRPAPRSGEAAPDAHPDAAADNLAYVVYTSGTTGRPKGVMIENRSVVNHVGVISALYGFADRPGEEVMLQSLNYAFDGGIVPMVLALLTGNTLVIVPDRLWQDSEKFTEYLNTHGVTHINGTPTFYKHIGLGPVPTLKRMVVGGEALDAACFREMTRANNVPIFNEYGPTEATVSTTSHPAREFDLAIGRPQDNSWILVLDEALRPVPVGAVGELHLAGPGLARGYLNLPELTAEKFIDNPFQSDAQKADPRYGPQGRFARLYRTGDLARWRSDGALEYVGRDDSQIKVRGFRVELGEIQALINACPGVVRSVVLPAESGERDSETGVTSLVGYYVAETALDADEILHTLERALPSYMVPAALVHLTALPMTLSGKLDVRALRELQPGARADHIAPQTRSQARVQEIVSRIIGVPPEHIGMRDDLFRLGLNSILVVKLIAALKNELRVEIGIASLFMYPTIAELVDSPGFVEQS